MAHPAQKTFLCDIRSTFPHLFVNKKVLDIGSLDINGNNRFLFDRCQYTGIDLGPGKNVDIVCEGHLFKSEDLFDIVISTECLEHDKFYIETFKNMIQLTTRGGLTIFTCASHERPEHGTSRTSPTSSPISHKIFNDYYRNVNAIDIIKEVDLEKIYKTYCFKFMGNDLYFYGIKR
eukprot:GHVR01103230.1.p2 GENE.GHVR01103230.1~~GHVR01103230.1.p2  ORF type:complete len:176 (+),score=15.50 GHVR01103230.1:541-1068(+)